MVRLIKRDVTASNACSSSAFSYAAVALLMLMLAKEDAFSCVKRKPMASRVSIILVYYCIQCSLRHLSITRRGKRNADLEDIMSEEIRIYAAHEAFLRTFARNCDRLEIRVNSSADAASSLLWARGLTFNFSSVVGETGNFGNRALSLETTVH
jgi:hypothetical protein